ncbi:AtpZ/AtpI family protein [Helicobacter suis]|uniref:Arginine biosynthesis bifunctional protein ArgJ n=1 Tax=Helicobacter suis TaxID=104628 RepID=A0A6J4CVI2_9HELI|nr:AtpZ/AtpI family protein [Helicobacter suis]BCD45084.1 Arginine biosynthesis bifunctional protein ArgJ [Helicobacter suis]BCD46917.1 Arginine biosynthesis bifunctional protein ArgJ [Helicobacter suis]BCD48675.1 Arginine biosynthesis bifunctional protein ArgJ [Helicobacter suis]BCD50453.1 Arginine biosynthesis bifunctional protein ArgJ [Helicobacter suis]BCD69479.1 Arginine biosynthesis bifunctional protein ArgJ [Helicobacter suis]
MKSPIKSDPKFKPVVEGANTLSLGISIVVALLLGVGIGYGLVRLTKISWLFWLGVFWGVGGAILNVYKAYKQAKAELDSLASDPKYQHHKI